MRTIVLNVVGLTRPILEQMPSLRKFAAQSHVATVRPAFPAVTCTAQSTYLTGLSPAHHGIVGNGWYNREQAEVQFWKQSNHLVRGRKLWEELREVRPGFTCAKLFWWYNMYSTADYTITPRPVYPADGRKVFDIYTTPMALREDIKKGLGEFPFRNFWGPAAGIGSSQWIAESAKYIEERYHPDLSLVYLPHLDYDFQRYGLEHIKAISAMQEIDNVVGDLLSHFSGRNVQCIIVSEYGITPVRHPIHLNRRFREKGWITVKEELGLEMIDCGASKAFAVADHQVAHIYVNDSSLMPQVRTLLESEPGVQSVFSHGDQVTAGIANPRSGDLVAVADERSWFTYYYWFDDNLAPDFARTVDIHRKVGYDPTELFVDPALRYPAVKIAGFLLKKKFGIRALLKVVPLDANLVRGSHGRLPENQDEWPIIITPPNQTLSRQVDATDVYSLVKQACLN